MGQTIRLTAEDGHAFSAYVASPAGARRGGIVVVQEVFGVNAHIRDVCDRFAAAGYQALAPALFDRLRTDVELDYDEVGVAAGRELVAELGWEHPLQEIAAAAKALEPEGKVGVVGYCWGGSVTFLAGARLNVSCAAVYYGRHIVEFLQEPRHCPMIMHFGAEDPLIPLENVEKIKKAYPEVPIYVYEGAGHGFNCDRRADYRAAAAGLALERTLDLFARHLT
jgi:carboxymethylenebutenolidase